jgi:hypothetical protein
VIVTIGITDQHHEIRFTFTRTCRCSHTSSNRPVGQMAVSQIHLRTVRSKLRSFSVTSGSSSFRLQRLSTTSS